MKGWIHTMNSTVFNKKNIPILCVLGLIAIVPFVLAVIFAGRVPDIGISELTDSIEVTASDGSVTMLEGAEDVRFYSELIGSATPITEDYERSEQTPFTVRIHNGEEAAKEYVFYPDVANNRCQFVSDDGKYFLVADRDIAPLFERAEFSAANVLAIAPKCFVTSAGGAVFTLNAVSGTWNFLSAGGEKASRELMQTEPSDVVRVYATAGMLSFEGEYAPDSTEAVLTRDGTEIFRGAFENLVSQDIISDHDTYYDLTINAVWNEKPDAKVSFGNVTYTTRLLYDVPATYTVAWKGKVSVADFATVMIGDYNEGDTLQTVCDYPVPDTIRVYDYAPDHCKVAFIPITYTTGKAGTYGLTLKTNDGNVQTVDLIISETKNHPSAAEQLLLVTDEALRVCYTEAALNELNETMAAKTAASENAILFDGGWLYPDGNASYQGAAGYGEYGTVRTVDGGVRIMDHYFADDIPMSEGSDVFAPNGGKVVFAGELGMTGKTVIIDHGMSILSVVGHLSEITVGEGETVTKGGTIGKSGSTGFSVKVDGAATVSAPSALYAVSVGGGFVDPAVMKSGVSFGKKQ